MVFVNTVSTEESLKVVKAEVLTEQLSFQDFISHPRVRAWTRQGQFWPSTFLKMLRLQHQSVFQNPLMMEILILPLRGSSASCCAKPFSLAYKRGGEVLQAEEVKKRQRTLSLRKPSKHTLKPKDPLFSPLLNSADAHLSSLLYQG